MPKPAIQMKCYTHLVARHENAFCAETLMRHASGDALTGSTALSIVAKRGYVPVRHTSYLTKVDLTGIPQCRPFNIEPM